MNNPIFKSLTFLTLIAGLLAFVVKFYQPSFPLDSGQLLAAILFFLGLFGVITAFRARRSLTPDIVGSLPFWQLIAGLLIFIFKFFAPAFPFDQDTVLKIVLFVLGWFQINPELYSRGLLPPKR